MTNRGLSKRARSNGPDPDKALPSARVRRAVGRPSDYEPEMIEEAAKLAEDGATDIEIAEHLGIHRFTFYRWQTLYPEFRDRVMGFRSTEATIARIKKSMSMAAIGFDYPEESAEENYDGEGKLVSRKVKRALRRVHASPAAAALILPNLDPAGGWGRQEHALVLPAPDGQQPEDADLQKLAMGIMALLGEAAYAPPARGLQPPINRQPAQDAPDDLPDPEVPTVDPDFDEPTGPGWDDAEDVDPGDLDFSLDG